MAFIFFILAVVVVITLFQFSDAKEKWNITEMAAKSINEKHGVHQLQKHQTTIFAIILGFILVIVSLTALTYDSMTFVSHVIENTNSNKVDSLTNIYNLPPPEEKQEKIDITHLAYPGDEGYAAVNQVAQEESRLSNSTSDFNEEKVQYESSQKNTKSTEDDVYAFEKQLFEETGGAQKRAELEKQREETQRKKQELEKQKQDQLIRAGSQNATIPKGGKTMVSYSLSGRKPHNNNMYYVRNPGYTCEQGSFGEVIINIKVNETGNVTSAIPKESYSSLNPCLVEQAVKYAKLSRFDGSTSSSQSGTITYQFVP